MTDWLGIQRRTVELSPTALPPFDRHYNGALFLLAGVPHIVYRCHDANGPYDTHFWHASKRSELWVSELDPITYQPVRNTRLYIPLNNCEDPRCVVVDGVPHVFFTHYATDQGAPRFDPYVAILGPEFAVAALHRVGLYGRGEIEKNWQFFHHQGAWHAVYTVEPWQVVGFDSQWRGRLITKSKAEYNWRYGCLRGGTPPVLVDGSFFTFFHSVWEHPDANRRVYFAGLLQFGGGGEETLFAPAGVSTFPIIFPNLAESSWLEHGRVCFPCGAVFNEQTREWAVSYGKNDQSVRIDFLKHDELVGPWLWSKVKPVMTVAAKCYAGDSPAISNG